MGHLHLLGIGDAGLPVPADNTHIDLAVSNYLPSLLDVLLNVLTTLQIQKVYLATTIKTQNPKQLTQIQQLLHVPIVFIPHDQILKDLSKTKALLHSGQNTPYANILYTSGVTF